jgi:hypothetical protein
MHKNSWYDKDLVTNRRAELYRSGQVALQAMWLRLS